MNRNPFDPLVPRCDTCRFWLPIQNSDGSKPVVGECRRYAPRPRIGELWGVIWPETYTEEWCGEYSEDPTR